MSLEPIDLQKRIKDRLTPFVKTHVLGLLLKDVLDEEKFDRIAAQLHELQKDKPKEEEEDIFQTLALSLLSTFIPALMSAGIDFIIKKSCIKISKALVSSGKEVGDVILKHGIEDIFADMSVQEANKYTLEGREIILEAYDKKSFILDLPLDAVAKLPKIPKEIVPLLNALFNHIASKSGSVAAGLNISFKAGTVPKLSGTVSSLVQSKTFKLKEFFKGFSETITNYLESLYTLLETSNNFFLLTILDELTDTYVHQNMEERDKAITKFFQEFIASYKRSVMFANDQIYNAFYVDSPRGAPYKMDRQEDNLSIYKQFIVNDLGLYTSGDWDKMIKFFKLFRPSNTLLLPISLLQEIAINTFSIQWNTASVFINFGLYEDDSGRLLFTLEQDIWYYYSNNMDQSNNTNREFVWRAIFILHDVNNIENSHIRSLIGGIIEEEYKPKPGPLDAGGWPKIPSKSQHEVIDNMVLGPVPFKTEIYVLNHVGPWITVKEIADEVPEPSIFK